MIAFTAPVGAVLLFELVLRTVGFGYPTGFFLPAKQADREVFIENQAFSKRFFPPGLERTPQPLVIDAVKPAETLRIIVFGESAAMGDPEPAFGFPRILEVMLGDIVRGKRVEVVNVALTAINSHVIREIARDCADLRADYWIVYMGNNEVVGPFGAGTVFGDQVPRLGVIRAGLALKKTRVGQLIDHLRWKITSGSKTPSSWEGMEMFLHQQVPSGDPRLARVYENFAGNLRDIVRLGHQAGAQVLLSTVAVNLKDCGPFASMHRPNLTSEKQAEWQRLFTAGRTHLLATNLAEAVQYFTQAAAIDDQHAESHYALSRTLLGLGQTNAARLSFEQALELDALRFRADARINAIIRDAATEMSDVKLVDVAGEIAGRSADGIPGEEFLFEHVHFNFEGNHQVARLFARTIAGPASPGIPTSLERFAEALAFTEFDRHRVLDEVRQRLEQPPFNQQFDHEARAGRIHRQLAATRTASFAKAKGDYERAIAARPADWVLRENFGTLLKDFDQLEDALIQWKRMRELLPHSADACFGLADTLDALGQSAEAIVWFRRALLLRPDSVETRNGLALALAGTGDFAAAVREFENILRRKPGFSEARVNLGRLLAGKGRTSEARTQYLEALRWNSNSTAARINLGKLLADEGKPAEAAAQYREAIRLKPDNAIAHFNLANALSASGDPASAAHHYGEAARLNPGFSEARYSFGLALARQGKNAEALAEFAEVVRLDPRFAEARLNYGVALAKAGRFEEAAAQFQETLRLNPSHSQARKFLEQAQARQNKTP